MESPTNFNLVGPKKQDDELLLSSIFLIEFNYGFA